MAKVFKFSGDPNKIDAGSNFIDYASVNSLPAIVKVKMVTVETEWTSKDGNEGWHLVCEIVQKAPKDKKGRQQQYSQLHRYIMLDSEWAEQRIAELCDAFLGKRPKSLNATTLVGKTAAVKLKGEVYEGEERAKIQRFLEAEEDEDDVDPEEEEEDDDVEDEDEDEDEDEEEAEDDEDDYNDWSLVQLRSELKRRELDSKGKKDELVERLQEDDEGSDDEEEDEESDDAGDEEDYSEYSLDELKAEVKRRGLRVLKRHTEDDLIEMLQEDDEDDEDPLDDDE
jgi:hypothetical protein